MKWMGWCGFLAAVATVAAADLPKIDGKETVASVNSEPITLEELYRQIGVVHQGVTDSEDQLKIPDPTALLDRVINAKLILQEARSIGLDELPEVAGRMERMRLGMLRNALIKEQVGEITEADTEAVERRYRDAVREWNLDSLLFEMEEDAYAFVETLEAGSDFETQATEVVDAGKATGGTGGRYLKPAELLPEVARVAAILQADEVSVPIRVPEGFAIVKLYSVRYPEDPAARLQAEQDALQESKRSWLEQYVADLRKKYTEVDREMLESLDYESEKPGFEKLRADQRVVAKVNGTEPVTVADLTEAIQKKFYHGVEGAIERKRINLDLSAILDRLLMERLTLREAKRLKIEETERFQNARRDLEDSLLFGVFLTRVINPDIRVDEEDLKEYYDQHIEDFSFPSMMRIDGLAFGHREDAKAALDKLRRGADLKWMRANAPRQATRETDEDLQEFRGRMLITSGLSEEVRKAVAGAVAGDFRFYAAAGGPFYVLAVREVIDAKPKPFTAVRGQIVTKVTGLKRQALVEDWSTKLRAASEIEIFASGEELGLLLGLNIAKGS